MKKGIVKMSLENVIRNYLSIDTATANFAKFIEICDSEGVGDFIYGSFDHLKYGVSDRDAKIFKYVSKAAQYEEENGKNEIYINRIVPKLDKIRTVMGIEQVVKVTPVVTQSEELRDERLKVLSVEDIEHSYFMLKNGMVTPEEVDEIIVMKIENYFSSPGKDLCTKEQILEEMKNNENAAAVEPKGRDGIIGETLSADAIKYLNNVMDENGIKKLADSIEEKYGPKAEKIMFDSADRRRLSNLEAALLYTNPERTTQKVVEYEMSTRNLSRDRIEAGYESLDATLKAKAENVYKIHDMYKAKTEDPRGFERKSLSEIAIMQLERKREIVDNMGVADGSIKYGRDNFNLYSNSGKSFRGMRPRKSLISRMKDAIFGTMKKYLGGYDNGLCYNN